LHTGNLRGATTHGRLLDCRWADLWADSERGRQGFEARRIADVTLSAKQQRFIAEYMTDLNATQAAIRAGYGERGASVQANRLLRNAKVAAEIAERTESG
jgi:hypothetical protein